MAEQFKFPDEVDDPVDTLAEGGEVEAADDGAEVEIEVVDDTPEKDRGRKPLEREVADPTDDEINAYSDGVKKRIKELTHARHDERRAKEALLRERMELEQVAQRLLQENKQLRQHVNTGEQNYASTIKHAAESELEMAKRRYKEAYESGDADAVVAAQEALTDAKMRANAANSFRPVNLPVETEVHVKRQPAQNTPQRLDEKTVRWQAKNQWFGSPGFEEVTSFALGLHQKLVNSGVDPRSDDYFEQIDARVKGKFPEVFGDADEGRSGRSSKKPSTVVAPSSRSAGAGKIKLTATQVALAKRLGLTNQQYALEMAKLERQNG